MDEVELTGKVVKLVPLRMDHAEPLYKETRDPETWRFWSIGPPKDLDTFKKWISKLLSDQKGGTVLPFTILKIDECDAPVGMTRYMELHPEHRRLEIGGSWIARRLWGSKVNVEAKYLLLRYAFETLKLARAELKTDLRNVRSQKAMEKIGAVREGVMRRHMTVYGGHQRDSVYYSFIADEWPETKLKLEDLLSKA